MRAPLSLASSLASILLALCAAPAVAQQDGTILHYLRSNLDGSEPEQIIVWLRADGPIEVYKHVEPCTNAALVTARIDPARSEAISLVGGRLGRDGRQQAFAWLDLEEPRQLAVRLGDRMSDPVQTMTLAGGTPWRLYDFDFADWNATANGPPPDLIAFELALIWPDGDSPLSSLGSAQAVYAADEIRGDVQTRRYTVSGPGFSGGDLWLDSDSGRVVEVAWGQPNHPGYLDYHLVLTGLDSGEAAWRTLLASHWDGCDAS